MGKASRVKGHSFERKIAIELRHLFPNAKRHLEFQKEEAVGVDLDNTGIFKFQCKKLKRYAPITCIEEIQLDPLSAEIPVLVTAGDALPPMAVLHFSDLMRLIQKAKMHEAA